ncbi:peptidylprolyl isomerase [Idiomarina sp. HP20-50]|uniref:peptidylprolyl isomerase n=1 Tax=Idiomarina sp. HP20-50 TaxID=3070813 RepID=UPI00294B553A|nr:peptidylprolyl isomerase [Idiomarina sp. HP20-50]MDV6316334.1 peptidylprolyl isomerase [Idiomarina sp. HP20-50]
MIQVNQVEIAEKEILAEMQYHPADSHEQAMAQAAEALVIGELFKQRAKELGIEVLDDASQGSEDDFIERLIEREVDRPEADDQFCQQYYEQNPERFKTSPIVEARHILLAAAPDDDLERVNAKRMAEQLIQQLQEGDDLGQLARQYSSCPSKETDGNLGQLSKGQTVPEFERQLFTAEEGLVKYPIETRYGFHVVSVDHKIEGKPLPYDAVKDKIAEYLEEKVHRKAVSQYIQALANEANIKGFDFANTGSPLLQ